jgi:hypothetical protein
MHRQFDAACSDDSGDIRKNKWGGGDGSGGAENQKNTIPSGGKMDRRIAADGTIKLCAVDLGVASNVCDGLGDDLSQRAVFAHKMRLGFVVAAESEVGADTAAEFLRANHAGLVVVITLECAEW